MNYVIPAPDDFSRRPEQDVFAELQRLGIAHQTGIHKPTSRVGDGPVVPHASKSLFLKDKETPFLITASAMDRVPLNELRETLQTAGRLSFAATDLLWDLLKVTPGSITPLALLHDKTQRVRFAIQQKLLDGRQIKCHPLRNDMTTTLDIKDFVRFIDSCGHAINTLHF